MPIETLRRAAAACVLAAMSLVGRIAGAEPKSIGVGAPQVLAYHKHYVPHAGTPLGLDPFDTPNAGCAARFGNEIVVSVDSKFLWIDGNTGQKTGETHPPFTSSVCALSPARHRSESVLLFVGREGIANSGDSYLTFVVMTRPGNVLAAHRTKWPAYDAPIAIELVGSWAVFNLFDSYFANPVRSFDIETLSEGPSYEIPRYMDLFRDRSSLFAITTDHKAFLLSSATSPRPAAVPPLTTLTEGCPELHGPLPVAFGADFSVAIDYGRPQATCQAQEGINLRDRGGRLVARRPLREGPWRYLSIVVPWDDGVRVVAQKGTKIGFELWKVPISF